MTHFCFQVIFFSGSPNLEEPRRSSVEETPPRKTLNIHNGKLENAKNNFTFSSDGDVDNTMLLALSDS